jgi:signal transduction histidine kinase
LRAAAERARELVQQILTFSRQKGEERKAMSLGPVISEAAKFLRSTLSAAIELRIDIAPDLPPVLGSSVQLHQVVMNLCVNAAHAMPRGGVLSVRASSVLATPELALRVPDLVASQQYVVIAVRDTGEGMTAATMSRIFEPFFSTKTNGEGSGLGLAVVHGIVKSHDGTIAVESAVGRGTVFEVYLPAAP